MRVMCGNEYLDCYTLVPNFDVTGDKFFLHITSFYLHLKETLSIIQTRF